MPVVVTTWSSPTPPSQAKLIEKVARVQGMDTSDGEFNGKILDALDEAVSDINTRLFEFCKSAETGIALTGGTNYVTLTFPFYRESLSYFVKTADSSNSPPLVYQDWVSFQRMLGDATRQGEPRYYSQFNEGADQRIYLWPTPDASTAATYTLTIEYYRRVPLISAVPAGDAIDVPPEIENVLLYGAKKRIMIDHLGAGHPDVPALAMLEREALDKLARIDRAHPDERKRFVLVDFAQRNKFSRSTEAWVKI